MAGYTQALLDALREAFARGALSVRHGDKTIQFDTTDGMLRRIRELERALRSTPAPCYQYVRAVKD